MEAGDWYYAAFDEMYNNRMDRAALAFYQNHQKELHLSECEDVLSIGPGNGCLDSFLASHCMPRLKRYIGVEPDGRNLSEFVQVMKNSAPGVEVVGIHGTAQTYRRPDAPLDMIILSHVLYHIDDTKSFLRQCLTWLKPTGTLLILHTEQEDLFTRMLASFQDNEFIEKHKSFCGYFSKDIVDDLDDLGIKTSMFNQDQVVVKWDLTKPTKEVYDFLLYRDTTPKQQQLAQDFINRTLPDGILAHQSRLFAVTKTDLPTKVSDQFNQNGFL